MPMPLFIHERVPLGGGDARYETLAGAVVDHVGEVPVVGDDVTFGRDSRAFRVVRRRIDYDMRDSQNTPTGCTLIVQAAEHVYADEKVT